MTDKKSLFIVMPAYNSANHINKTIKRIPKSVWEKLTELTIVNDGSTDQTLKIIQKLKRKNKKITILNKLRNQGYACAQKSAFEYALSKNADFICLLHSDGQYAPELLEELLAPLYSGQVDVVQGSRILGGKALEGGMPLYKYVANIILSKLENLAFGMNMSEYHSGYMLYNAKALRAIQFQKLSNTFHFDGEMLIIAEKKKLRILQIPIPTRYADEKSSLKPIPYGFAVLKIILDYKLGKYDDIIKN